MSEPIVPGGSEAAGRRFLAWITKRAEYLEVKRTEMMLAEITHIAVDLVRATPKFTGAASGEPASQAWRLRWPSHPAYGMTIGNYFNGGETGWQIGTKKVNQYRTDMFIFNPMWEPYLQFVESGAAHLMNHAIHPGGFVKAAWGQHLARRRQQ